jgi:hypothetical protein
VITVQSKYECFLHKVQHTVEVNNSEYLGWINGMRIQDAMPSTSISDREILKTGTCQEAWDSMFAEEECSEDCDGSSHSGKMCK